jgi:hypothetical protein
MGVLFWAVLALVQFAILAKPLTAQEPPSHNLAIRAQDLWEKAIAAKGGRERLHSVNSLLFMRGTPPYLTKLFVFPDRFWSWDDNRPSPIGPAVEMYNLADGTGYIAYDEFPKGAPARRLSNFAGHAKAAIREGTLLYLMESRWLKPRPLRAEESELDGKSVDVVYAEADGRIVAFTLDKQNHLPIAVTTYSRPKERELLSEGMRPEGFCIHLSDYKLVGGIAMPTSAKYGPGGWGSESIEINVQYDERVFKQPPSIGRGALAWKK